MDTWLSDILIFITFLAEVYILCKIERKIWGSFYTPVTVLAVPFTVVLCLVLLFPPSFGFVSFYFPSLIVWMAGLLLMAIPSWLIGYGFRKQKAELPTLVIERPKHESGLYIVAGILIVLFLFRLRGMMNLSLLSFGSDDFGEEFATHGAFGHLLHILVAISIISFACIRKEKKWIPIAIILLVAVISFVNQVKSWVIIPLLAGFLLLLISQKAHLNAKIVLGVTIGGLSIFIGSYLVLFIIGNQAEYDDHMLEYIIQHVFHYIASGVLGWSEDVRMGILETSNPEVLFTPIINLARTFTGAEFVDPVNPHFLEIENVYGLGDNVRTFFGTIYAIGGGGFWILYILLFSSFIYLIRFCTMRIQSIYVTAIDAWFCALLAMGWFEFYFFHVITFEVPIFILLIAVFDKIRIKRKEDVPC